MLKVFSGSFVTRELHFHLNISINLDNLIRRILVAMETCSFLRSSNQWKHAVFSDHHKMRQRRQTFLNGGDDKF